MLLALIVAINSRRRQPDAGARGLIAFGPHCACIILGASREPRLGSIGKLRQIVKRFRRHLLQIAAAEVSTAQSPNSIEKATALVDWLRLKWRRFNRGPIPTDEQIAASLASISTDVRALGNRLSQAPEQPSGDHLSISLDEAADDLTRLHRSLYSIRSAAHADVEMDVAPAWVTDFSNIERLIHLTRRTVSWLAANQSHPGKPASGAAPAPADGMLVSIVMPTRNRADIIERAIESIRLQEYQRWELLIIDDGSTDETLSVVRRHLDDRRVRYIPRDSRGVCAARNIGLAEARGELIAYLDTDNTWYPQYLRVAVDAFERDADLQSAYAAQIVLEHDTGFSYIRAHPFDLSALSRWNYIDLNVFVHRRQLAVELGGFDERFKRLNDWDLIRRYTARGKTELLTVLGGTYNQGARPDQISATQNHNYHRYLVTRKHSRRLELKPKLKVLYALWHYPQLSESYVRTELVAVVDKGVDVEVWSENDVAAPYASEVPFHRGTLSDALRTVRPDLVHTHWLDMAEQYSTEVSAAGLPLTVRGHGFEFTPELVARLDRNPVVHAAYVFPHMAARCRGTSTKIRPLPAAFNPDLYEPAAEKNPRLVVRTGCALPSKDYATFLRTARLCPNHTFVLVLCRAFMKESYADEVIALKNQLDAPVEVHINWQHEEIASLMKRAGVYLHTNGRDSPFGMPISIIEAMATGSYVIGRRCAGASEFLGDAGELYDSPEEAAALIQRTESWTSQDWHRASMRSIERAYSEFASPEVTNRIVEDWLRITGKN